MAYRDVCPTCGHQHTRWRGCGRRSCAQPGCVEHRTGQRARRAYSRLEGAGLGAAWGVVVLTLPPAARAVAAELRHFKRLAAAAHRVAARWLDLWSWRGRGARVRGVMFAHPTGEGGTWAPHFNVLVPLRDAVLGKGRYSLPPEALHDLRHRWRVELRELGIDVPPVVQVFWEYRINERQKRHAARYFARHFPGWSSWVLRVRWFGPFCGVKVEVENGEQSGRCARCGDRYVTRDVCKVPPGGRWPPWS